MNAHIYLVANKLNEKQYVGQTITESNKLGHGRLMRVAYKKHGKDNFSYDKIKTGISDRNTLNFLERFWIATYNTVAPNGYNYETGGSEGQVWTDERRAKHSQARVGKRLNRPLGSKSGMKGKPYPEEGKRKLSEAMRGTPGTNTGKKASEETRAKMSASQKAYWNSLPVHPNAGKKASEETKAKMSASRTGRIQSPEERAKRSAAITAWHKKRKEQQV